jgi:hypothetical protein
MSTQDVVDAVQSLERAVRETRSSNLESLGTFLVVVFVIWAGGDFWHWAVTTNRLFMAINYHVQYSDWVDAKNRVVIASEPHDCEFLTAPFGSKHCSYEKVVTKVMWATSVANSPIRSFDGGMTWETQIPGKCYVEQGFPCPNAFDPVGNKVPRTPNATGLLVSWMKKSDD